MKVLCIEQVGDTVKFQLPGRQKPVVGHSYTLERYHEGTEAQNKVFHSLTMEYFNSGMHSYHAENYEEFKKQIKKSLGMGFDSVAYTYVETVEGSDGKVEYKPRMKVVGAYDEIPEEIRSDPEVNLMTRGILKSWSAYTKKERSATIDNLLTEMRSAGVNSVKFEEIQRGMGN